MHVFISNGENNNLPISEFRIVEGNGVCLEDNELFTY